MKDLGEEHNLIIIQELIPSSAFGSSLFNLYPHWGSLDCISSKTFLKEETSSSWFSGHSLRFSQFNIISRPPPSLFFFPHCMAKVSLLYPTSVVSMLWVRRSWLISSKFVNFKDSVFSAFWALEKLSCPVWDINDSFLAPRKTNLPCLESDTLHLFILKMRWMFLACDFIERRVGPHWSLRVSSDFPFFRFLNYKMNIIILLLIL